MMKVGCLLLMLLLGACSLATNDATPTVPPLTAVARATRPPTESAAPTSTGTPLGTNTPGPTATPRPPFIQYTVQPNDTLGGIAQKFGTTVDAILRANNLPRPEALRAGQVIIIPLPTLTPTVTATATLNATQIAIAGPTAIIYIVQGGDVLSAIAAKYNLPVDEIMRANGLTDTFLRVGQQLIIPAPTVTPTATSTALPTSTPTQGLAFSAPQLLFPPDGASYKANDVILMNWTAVGALNDDQFYVLRLRTLDGTRNESIWLKTPSYRLPTSWHDTTIVWDIIVLQVTNVKDDGTREGKIESPFSEARQFTWQ